jgi:hypothetical protein
VLVEELGAVVDLVVNNHVDVAGGVVLSNILHGELLLRGHDCGVDVTGREENWGFWSCPRAVVAQVLGGIGIVGGWKWKNGREERRREEWKVTSNATGWNLAQVNS